MIAAYVFLSVSFTFLSFCCCPIVGRFGFSCQSFYSVLLFGLVILCGSSIRLDRLGRWLVLGLNLVHFALSLSMIQPSNWISDNQEKLL